MVGCVFLSQNWAPLVKKIHKWLAAFFCPKIGHHSLKKDSQMVGCVFLSQNWAPLEKNSQMVGCVFFVPKLGTTLALKNFTNGWLRFFRPKIGHHSLKKFTNGWLRFFRPKIGHHFCVEKIYKWLASHFSSQNWPPLVKKIQLVGCWIRPKKTTTRYKNSQMVYAVSRPKIGTPVKTIYKLRFCLQNWEFTNGCFVFLSKTGHHFCAENLQMVGCVFLSQNWAPLVKKIHKWLAAFFCPKIGHHSLKKIYKCLAAFFCPKIGHHSVKKDFSILFGTRNQQLIVLTPELGKLTSTKIYKWFGFVFLFQNWAPLLRWKNLQMVGCVFSSQKLGTTRWKNSQMVGCVFSSQNWAPLVKKIHKWLAAFFCPKIGHHSFKKFTNGWLRFFVPKLGTTR